MILRYTWTAHHRDGTQQKIGNLLDLERNARVRASKKKRKLKLEFGSHELMDGGAGPFRSFMHQYHPIIISFSRKINILFSLEADTNVLNSRRPLLLVSPFISRILFLFQQYSVVRFARVQIEWARFFVCANNKHKSFLVVIKRAMARHARSSR